MAILFLSVALLLSPILSQARHPDSSEKFLQEARSKFVPVATQLSADYKLATFSWYLDQETGKLTFSKDGVTKVIADAQLVGSYSTESNTWMWSWANNTIVPGMKKDMGKVKEYGERNRYRELTTAKFECDEEDAATMTAAAGYLLKSKGAYRGPTQYGYVYILITDIKWADAKQ